MTRLTMVGITHRGAPLAPLERVAIRREDRPGLLAMLRVLGCSETVLLSTCSRVELYVGNASPGLTSRVLGEVEILAQTRTAFREAAAAGMSGPCWVGSSRRRCAPVVECAPKRLWGVRAFARPPSCRCGYDIAGPKPRPDGSGCRVGADGSGRSRPSGRPRHSPSSCGSG